MAEYQSRNKSNKLLRFAPDSPLQAPFFQILVPGERRAGVAWLETTSALMTWSRTLRRVRGCGCISIDRMGLEYESGSHAEGVGVSFLLGFDYYSCSL